MCGAGREQARGLIESLAPAEVHVVITARDTLGMLTSGWAEYVKNGGTKPLAEMHGDRLGGQAEFGWRTWDLGGVLRRWARHVPPQQVHVLPMPGPGAPRDQHWRNLAGVLGLDPDRYDAPEEPRNPALGVVQIELLRRVNPHLDGVPQARRPGHLDQGLPRRGPPGAPGGGAARCRRRAGGRQPASARTAPYASSNGAATTSSGTSRASGCPMTFRRGHARTPCRMRLFWPLRLHSSRICSRTSVASPARARPT